MSDVRREQGATPTLIDEEARTSAGNPSYPWEIMCSKYLAVAVALLVVHLALAGARAEASAQEVSDRIRTPGGRIPGGTSTEKRREVEPAAGSSGPGDDGTADVRE